MKKLVLYILMLLALPISVLAQTKTVGTTGADYPTLNEAFFDINSGNIKGSITLQIIDTITESATAELFESGYGGTSSYTSITIYPTGSGYKINGDIDGPLISLNGADNVIFDGRVNASGSAKDLTISNTNTGASASTILFSESASTNTVRFCIIQGSETGTSSGIIFFSTASTGPGNDGNTIANNMITCDAAGRSINAIYSFGTSGSENSGNTISDNNIYNFLKHGTASNGIFLSSYTTSCTISGNSFYETTSFVPAASVMYNCIKIENTTGTGFTISGNFIGGQSPSCGGSAWDKTNAFNNIFYAIYLNVGTFTASNIQNNTIQNITWRNSSSASWTGIHVAAGAVNIGTGTGNSIGATTGTGSITVTNGAANSNVYGINIASGGTVDCQYNTIGSITAGNFNTNNATSLYGINKTSTAGTTNISNNTIGSATQPSSVYASSASSSNMQSLYGISNSGIGTITISGNTIANLTNGTTNNTPGTAGLINGIKSTDGNNTISNNTIHDLTIANANNSTNNSASICGIALTGATLKTITGNSIYNLKNTFVTFSGSVIGLYFTGNTGVNTVNENFIHSLSVTGASSSSASIYGIQIAAGATTYSNNIISLGGSTQTTIYGIYETGAAGNNNNLYFNTIYINGLPTSGTENSYALYSSVATNIRNFRNNIFYNARSNSGSSGKHYAIYIVSSGGTITTDYNNYYTSGTGGMLGYLATDKTSLGEWKTATGQDAASLALNPSFTNDGGTLSSDYLPSEPLLVAVAGTGILFDYNGSPRSIPIMGAFEIGCINPVSGGTIGADQSGCTPFDPAVINSIFLPSGYSGFLEYKWQQSTTSDGAGFSDIPTSNTSTYNPGLLTQNTWFKRIAKVSCKLDWTGAVESNVVKVTVNALPTAGAITGGNALCMGTSLSLTSNASGAGPFTYSWTSSSISIATVNNSGIVTAISVGSTNITYTVTDGNSCNSTSAPNSVSVSVPLVGLVVSGTGTICSGTATNITVALSEIGTNYQLRNDNANELVGSAIGGNGGTIFLTTGNLTYNTAFNVLATNSTTSCSAELTEIETISIDPPSVAGSISGTSSITYGSSTGIMTLTGYTGLIQRWEKRFNSGSWTIISNTNATYSETPDSAGTWSFRAVVKSGSCSESISSVFSLTVNSKTLTITTDNKSKNYGASLPALTLTYSGLVNGDTAPATLPVISTTATASSPSGNYPITATGAADPNYNISYVAGSLTVDKVPLTITADNKSKNYGASLPVLTVTYSGLVNGDVAPSTLPVISTTATASSPAGTYPVTATGAADPNYNISYVTGTLTVDKAPLTITADNKSKNYGASLPVLTVTYSGLVFGDVAPASLPVISTTATASSPAGTYPVTSTGAADPNYNISYVAGTLTVDKAPLTITADNKSKNYGVLLPVLTFSYSGFVNGDVAPATLPAISTTATASSPAGNYPITATGAADPNYNISYVAGSLTVDKVPLTITADNKSKNYGASLPVLTFNYSGFVNGDVAPATLPVISTTATASSPAGNYPITATGAADPNYNISYVAGSLTVDKVPLTITADNKSKNYGASLPVLTVTYSGLVNGDVAPATLPVISTTATASSPPGTYPVTATGAADLNYNISYVAGTLTVDKATLTITADNKSKTYGDPNPPLTITYSGFIGTDDVNVLDIIPVITTTGQQNSNAGTYPIVASGGSDNNYIFIYTDGILTINKANQTIVFSILPGKVYGDPDYTISAVASSSLQVSFNSNNPGVATITGNAIHIAGAGTAVITASQPGNENYNAASPVLQTLNVSKANLTFTADSKSKIYQAQNPVLTYVITGFLFNETVAVLDVQPTIQTTAVQNSITGSYPITITGGSDNNYNYLYIQGSLLITKIPQTITFSGFPLKLLVEDVFTLIATSTSGLTVLFESKDILKATITGDKLTGISKGAVQIRAYHPGDQNYNSAETFATVEIYSTHKEIMHLFTPNNDGFNDLWELPDLTTWGKCDVKVYNRWGKLIFADADYNNQWDGESNGNPLPEGAYYFVIKTENAGVIKGTVNIVR